MRQVAANSKDDASIASSIGSSSGCGSLTKKSKTQVASSGMTGNILLFSFKRSLIVLSFLCLHIDYQPSIEVDPQSIVSSIITDSGISDVSETPQTSTIFDRSSTIATVNSTSNLNAQSQQQQQQQQQQQNIGEMGHSRNSSNTSQVSSVIYRRRAAVAN
jgi:hypothetical protein